MKHPFDNARVSHEPISDFPICGIIESTSEIGEVIDKDGLPHQVNLETQKVVSFCDNIPKDIDADTLSLANSLLFNNFTSSLENSLKNNFNLNEVNGYTTSEESPESTVNLVNFETLSPITKPVNNISEPKSDSNVSELINNNQ